MTVRSEHPAIDLRDFAEKCGISHTHLDSIEKGVDPRTGKPVSVTVETLKKIANAMGMTINDLLIQSGDVKIEDLQFDNANIVDIPSNTVKIPVLGVIKAGIPIEAQQDIIDYVEIPKDWTKGGKEYYGLKISGDSMYPKYDNDDIVIFLKTNEVISGKDCAFMVNGFDATFKKVLFQNDSIILQPYNSNYQVQIFNKEQIEQLPVKIIGIAKEKRTKL